MSGANLMTPSRFQYLANGVNFDGANDYLLRGGGLTGVADSKLFSGAVFFKRNSIGTTQNFYSHPASDLMIFLTGNGFRVSADNAAGTEILRILSSAITDTVGWHSAMFSVDMADVAKRHLYIDDVSDLSVTTYDDDTIDFTVADHAIGARTDGTRKMDACVAVLWIAPGQYVDMSVVANRRKIVNSFNRPVDLGTDGSLVTGTAPLMFFDRETVNWHTNKGTGGGFTENGALTDCATDP